MRKGRTRARTRGRGAGAALCAAAAALALTPPAQAAPEWNYGLPEEALEESCLSIGNPDIFHIEPNVSVRAGMLIDPQDIPEVGEVFYGGVFIGQVRGCFEDFVIPEALPPAGVELAVSTGNPVRCFTIPSGGTQTPLSAAQGCPENPGAGANGGRSLSPNGDPSMGWRLAPQEVLLIEFPLRSSRPLTGLPGGPTCPERAARTGPCPADAAGDFLQAPIKVIDNGTSPTLTPAIGLFAVPAQGGGGAGPGNPAPGPEAENAPAARLLSVPGRARAGAGVRITVRVPRDGATVSAVLRARGVKGVLAKAGRRGVRAGRLELRLRPTRQARRRLKRAGRVKATVSVTVKLPGRPAMRAKGTLRLRP